MKRILPVLIIGLASTSWMSTSFNNMVASREDGFLELSSEAFNESQTTQIGEIGRVGVQYKSFKEDDLVRGTTEGTLASFYVPKSDGKTYVLCVPCETKLKAQDPTKPLEDIRKFLTDTSSKEYQDLQRKLKDFKTELTEKEKKDKEEADAKAKKAAEQAKIDEEAKKKKDEERKTCKGEEYKDKESELECLQERLSEGDTKMVSRYERTLSLLLKRNEGRAGGTRFLRDADQFLEDLRMKYDDIDPENERQLAQMEGALMDIAKINATGYATVWSQQIHKKFNDNINNPTELSRILKYDIPTYQDQWRSRMELGLNRLKYGGMNRFDFDNSELLDPGQEMFEYLNGNLLNASRRNAGRDSRQDPFALYDMESALSGELTGGVQIRAPGAGPGGLADRPGSSISVPGAIGSRLSNRMGNYGIQSAQPGTSRFPPAVTSGQQQRTY